MFLIIYPGLQYIYLTFHNLFRVSIYHLKQNIEAIQSYRSLNPFMLYFSYVEYLLTLKTSPDSDTPLISIVIHILKNSGEKIVCYIYHL